VGETLGSAVGTLVGSNVGSLVGLKEGYTEGTLLGIEVFPLGVPFLLPPVIPIGTPGVFAIVGPDALVGDVQAKASSLDLMRFLRPRNPERFCGAQIDGDVLTDGMSVQ
jgi:hypothetical protein